MKQGHSKPGDVAQTRTSQPVGPGQSHGPPSAKPASPGMRPLVKAQSTQAPVQRRSLMDRIPRVEAPKGPLTDWSNAVFRPDLYQPPVSRKGSGEAGPAGDLPAVGEERRAGEVLQGGGQDGGKEAPIPLPAMPPDMAAIPAQDNPDNLNAPAPQGTGEQADTAKSTPVASAPVAATETAASETGPDASAAAATLAGGNVLTVIRDGGSPTTAQGAYASSPAGSGQEKTAYSVVAPGGTPTQGSHENTCLPSTARAVLAWDVVEDGDSWRADCQSLTLAGQVNVKPWPNRPNEMVVPNTPNPVDGGNINNTAGSSNHWKAAIDDMANYHQPGGGAGPNWHDTAASSAHEWAHWNTDYIQDSVMSAAGGNWPSINAQIDALRVPKSAHATKDAARAALQPRVDALLQQWRSKTIARWNAIPDTPGVAGSTGYEAGARVLSGHIAAIEAYRKSKGWT